MAIEGLDDISVDLGEISTEGAEEQDDTNIQDNTNDDSTTNSDTNDDTDTSTDTNDKSVDTDDSAPAGDTSASTDDKDEDVPADIDTKDLSGIEQYLSKFNIEGGMVDFKDGSRTHFDELTPEKQVDVLSKLHESSTQGIEEKFGLDEDEIGLINYMRQQEGTIDEVINNIALQRAQTYISSQQVKDMDINKMGNDDVYTSFLMKSNADITTEQIEQDLETAKKMSNYDNIVKNIRQGMLTDQENTLSQQKQEDSNNMLTEIEDQRKQVVETVSKMEEVDGLSINDGIKNDVLDLILNVDDDGDSLFMTDVFSDPEKLFKAAFWFKNGSDIIATREDYWKKEKSAAYKRGISDAQTGKKTFTSSDVEDKNKTTLHHGDPEEVISFDDLYTT